MRYFSTIVLVILSFDAFADAKHTTKECMEIIAQIEGVLKENQEFLLSPNVDSEKKLLVSFMKITESSLPAKANALTIIQKLTE